MKLALLSAAVLLGLAAQAEAATIYYAPPTIAGSARTQVGSVADATSPFGDSVTPYLVVTTDGSATFAGSAFGGSDLSAGTFTFFDGTPDTFNKITFDTGASFSGDAIRSPADGSGAGALVTLTGIGAYSTVTFTSTGDSFEFAAVSPVPLPASLPMFGAALLVLAGASYGLNRRNVAKAKSIVTTA